jgi:two-component system, OmpR family, sensor histidine kinase QseC
MRLPTSVRPSLVRTITLRLAITSILAMLLQLTIVVARAYLDEDDLNRSYVTRQARSVLSSVRASRTPRGVQLKTSAVPAQYRGLRADAYAFRILTADGSIVGEHNGAMLAQLSPWRERPSRTQDFWLVDLDAVEKLYVAGGLRQKVGNKELWVEVLTRGDPDRVYLGILAAEVLDDVWMPMIPVVVLTLGVAVFSVRRSLSSLVRAATQAEGISPLDRSMRFDASGMPREAAIFAIAINDLLDRVGTLVRAQRMFIARAAHELRTPLAIMMLELGRDPPRVSNLHVDLQAMRDMVDRLLTLARLQSIEQPDIEDLELGKLVEEAAGRLREWAAGTDHKITVLVNEPARVAGDAAAVRETLRNLIENAIRHTPRGTHISVTAGPAGSIVVEDDGPGLAVDAIPDLLQPFKKGAASSEGAGLGLAIVKQAVDLHEGTLAIGRSALGGARFSVLLPGRLPVSDAA